MSNMILSESENKSLLYFITTNNLAHKLATELYKTPTKKFMRRFNPDYFTTEDLDKICDFLGKSREEVMGE